MIPAGSLDPDRVALSATAPLRDAPMSDVEGLRMEAETALELLLTRWRDQRSNRAAYFPDDDAVREAILALSAVEVAVDRFHHGPRMIRPRSHSGSSARSHR